MRSGADFVEHPQLGACQDELAVLVLAVEGDQARAQLAQVADRGGASVEKGAGAPVHIDAPRQDQPLQLLLDAHVLGQQAGKFLTDVLGHREHSLDVGLLGARPDDAAARASSHQKIQGVGEHRLAGARLAGEHVQTGREEQLGALDQEQVFHAQLAKHVRQVYQRPPTDRPRIGCLDRERSRQAQVRDGPPVAQTGR